MQRLWQQSDSMELAGEVATRGWKAERGITGRLVVVARMRGDVYAPPPFL
jgi:hypothetical protein